MIIPENHPWESDHNEWRYEHHSMDVETEEGPPRHPLGFDLRRRKPRYRVQAISRRVEVMG